jgi:hypothetical protein
LEKTILSETLIKSLMQNVLLKYTANSYFVKYTYIKSIDLTRSIILVPIIAGEKDQPPEKGGPGFRSYSQDYVLIKRN